MKRIVTITLGLALAAITAASLARAESSEVPFGVVTPSEVEDAWLHDRCSFRGQKTFTPSDLATPGAVAALQRVERDFWGKPKPFVKIFRCAEKPPFLKTAFTPAPAEALACSEAEAKPTCVKPLVRVVARAPEAPAVTPAAPPRPPPPSMPEPTPPKWRKKAAKDRIGTRKNASKRSETPAVARVAAKVDPMDAGY